MSRRPLVFTPQLVGLLHAPDYQRFPSSSKALVPGCTPQASSAVLVTSKQNAANFRLCSSNRHYHDRLVPTPRPGLGRLAGV